MTTTNTLIQSYVNNRYFVSTIRRECSAVAAAGMMYYETMVWKWDAKTKKRGRIVRQYESHDSIRFALQMHAKTCARFAPHVHEANTTDDHRDACRYCELDLRNEIHHTETR